MNDPLQPKPDAELEELLEEVANQDISSERMMRLDQLLRDDPVARHAYLERMSFEAAVACEFPVDSTAPVLPASKRTPATWRGLAIAAAVLLCGFLAWTFYDGLRGPADSEVADSPQVPAAADDSLLAKPIASITGLWDARFKASFDLLALHDQITSGPLHLLEGRAQITFHSGAVVEVTGPALLDLESPYRTRLEDGEATIFVPTEAQGFIIDTPTSLIRDHGTRFSVDVDAGRSTQVHVVEGLVEVSNFGDGEIRETRWLETQQAARLTEGGIEVIDYRKPDRPTPTESPDTSRSEQIHWSFDDWNNARHHSDEGSFELAFRRHGVVEQPNLIDGRFGKALRFNGSAQYAISDFPGVGGSKARTVAFWVRVQPGAPRDTPNGIVSWGSHKSSRKWQIAWNADLERGDLGAIRVEFGDGFVIGSTDIRDGTWHHITAVFLGGERPDAATYVRIYVDGALERNSYRRQNRIDTSVNSNDAEPLVVGRYLGFWPGREPFYFEGDVDELFVTDTVLQPSQILGIIRTNRLK